MFIDVHHGSSDDLEWFMYGLPLKNEALENDVPIETQPGNG